MQLPLLRKLSPLKSDISTITTKRGAKRSPFSIINNNNTSVRFTALQNTDNFLVNRGGQSYKVNFQEVNSDATQALADAAAAQAAADAAQATADQALAAAGYSEVPLTSGSFDMSLGSNFSAGAITIANPTNTTVGKRWTYSYYCRTCCLGF